MIALPEGCTGESLWLVHFRKTYFAKSSNVAVNVFVVLKMKEIRYQKYIKSDIKFRGGGEKPECTYGTRCEC